MNIHGSCPKRLLPFLRRWLYEVQLVILVKEYAAPFMAAGLWYNGHRLADSR